MAIYRIDHYYNHNHNETCLFVETDIEMGKIIEILAAIQFVSEEILGETVLIENKHIMEVLELFYNAKDVKQKYERYLEYTITDVWRKHERKCWWHVYNVFEIEDIEGLEDLTVIHIDLYAARENYCGNPQDVIKRCISEIDEFVKYIVKLKQYYLED